MTRFILRTQHVSLYTDALQAAGRSLLSDDLHSLSTDTSPALPDALSAGLFGDRASFDTVVVPETADDLACRHLAHVHADQPDNEHAVATQVVLGKLGQDSGLALRRVERAQLLAEVLDVSGPVERPEQPAQRVDGRYERQKDVPEPDKDEQLLVEEVDRQCTLHHVLVNTGLVADLELAERHSREPLRVGPVLAAYQPCSIQLVLPGLKSWPRISRSTTCTPYRW